MFKDTQKFSIVRTYVGPLFRKRRLTVIGLAAIVMTSSIGCTEFSGLSGSVNYDGKKLSGEIHYSPPAR